MRIGMTDHERAQHRPGTGIKTNGVGQPCGYLNRTVSYGDVYEPRVVHTGADGRASWVWFIRGTKTRA